MPAHRILALRRGERHGLARQRPRRRRRAALAEQEHTLGGFAGTETQRRGGGGAGVEAGTGTLAEMVGDDPLASCIEQLAAVAGPLLQRGIGSVVAAQRQERGAATEAGMAITLGREQHVDRQQVAT